jgi:uncharacterized OsmC-like protein
VIFDHDGISRDSGDMYKFPMKFNVQVRDNGDPTWTSLALPSEASTGVNTSLPVAIPPGFLGPGGGYSPEDFFALAMANCFAATFRVVASKSSVSYRNLEVDCELEVDLNEAKKPWMARCHLKVRLFGPSNEERAMRLLEKVSGQCLIHQSVKTETKYSFEVLA